MMPLTCVIEGLPGAGKTTTCQALAQSPRLRGAALLPEFLPESEGDREDISFYIENERGKSARMAAGSEPWLICDRYWQSSAIYCAATANAIALEELQAVRRMIHKTPLHGCYAFVHLQVPVEVSRARARQPSVPNQWCSPAFSQRVFALYELVYQRAQVLEPELLGKLQVPAASLCADEVAAMIEAFLLELRASR